MYVCMYACMLLEASRAPELTPEVPVPQAFSHSVMCSCMIIIHYCIMHMLHISLYISCQVIIVQDEGPEETPEQVPQAFFHYVMCSLVLLCSHDVFIDCMN